MFKESVIAICLTVILVLRLTSGGKTDPSIVLNEKDKENLETLLEEKLNTCPRYSC